MLWLEQKLPPTQSITIDKLGLHNPAFHAGSGSRLNKSDLGIMLCNCMQQLPINSTNGDA